jgi:hypothetical protein
MQEVVVSVTLVRFRARAESLQVAGKYVASNVLRSQNLGLLICKKKVHQAFSITNNDNFI